MKPEGIHDTAFRKSKLQENLQRLKAEFGSDIRFRRTKTGPTAPFPLYVSITIQTPDIYAQYDIEALEFRIGITEAEEATFAYDLSVLNEHLPDVLKQKIAEYLLKYLETDCQGRTSPDIVKLCHDVRDSCFGTLVNLVHEVLEPYEAVNPDGSSIRRIAFVDKDIHVEAVQSLEKAPAAMTRTEEELLERLQKDLRYLSKKATEGSFLYCPAKDSYSINQEDYTKMADFQHTHGIGVDLSTFASKGEGLLKVSLSFSPTSKEWRDVVPYLEENTLLNLTFFIGKNYPSKSSILCRLQLTDDAAMDAACSDLVSIFERLCLAQAFASVNHDTITLKDIFQYCSNYADRAFVQAMRLWEDCKQQRREKEADVANSAPKYMCILQNLQMEGIDALSPNSMEIEVLCNRCRNRFVLELPSFASKWNTVEQDCSHCHARVSISARARIIHESCNSIVILCCEGCSPLDILPSCSTESQCQHCSHIGIMASFHQGRWNEITCRSCHERNAFMFERISFQKLVAGPRKGQGAKKGAVAAEPELSKPDAHLALGQPLPDTGTCSHYRHSHRWLRFPCCGKRFPCDLCHEEATDGHEMKWATRMVCGFCSLEQSLANRCAACHKRLTTSASRPEGRSTRFWEGGTGQRNKRYLSVKDSHKYRNSNAKTVSRKAFAARKNVKSSD